MRVSIYFSKYAYLYVHVHMCVCVCCNIKSAYYICSMLPIIYLQSSINTHYILYFLLSHINIATGYHITIYTSLLRVIFCSSYLISVFNILQMLQRRNIIKKNGKEHNLELNWCISLQTIIKVHYIAFPNEKNLVHRT